MQSVIFGSAILLAFTVHAAAIDAPPLPSSAKKLTQDEILALYKPNVVMVFENFTKDKTVAGEVTHNANGELSGFWIYNKKQRGDITGTAGNKGDKWCFKAGSDPEICALIYQDGPDIYEVGADGQVVAKVKVK